MQMRLARVVSRALALHPAVPHELREDPAQIARIEGKVAHEVAGQRPLAVRDFVEHARFGQRVLAVEQAVAQYSDLLRVEAVELADRADVPIRVAGVGHGWRLQGAARLSIN